MQLHQGFLLVFNKDASAMLFMLFGSFHSGQISPCNFISIGFFFSVLFSSPVPWASSQRSTPCKRIGSGTKHVCCHLELCEGNQVCSAKLFV